MATESANSDVNNEVFIYMGEGGPRVPDDVVHVSVHPSVIAIPQAAFAGQDKLKEVELHEGLIDIGTRAFRGCLRLKRIAIPSTVTVIRQWVFGYCTGLEEVEFHDDGLVEIGEYAFGYCKSMKHITLPSSLKVIDEYAFYRMPLMSLNLPDGIERIGNHALYGCNFTHFTTPPHMSTIPDGVFCECESMISVELSESVTEIEQYAFYFCYSLRNVAIPTTSVVADNAFMFCSDLRNIFDYSADDIIQALKHRFDGLPIHKLLYYQPYEGVTSDQLGDMTNRRCGQRRSLRSKLEPTGQQQDCLGMTPLHIMACSTVQDLNLYRVLVDTYPENLITEDRWGALPLLYAVWGNAPSEIVQYLVERYQSLYPDYEFDWTEMMITLGKADASFNAVQTLVSIQQESFPQQNIDWDIVLERAVTSPSGQYFCVPSSDTLRTLVQCKFSKRIDAIGPKKLRCSVLNLIKRLKLIEHNKKSIDFSKRKTYLARVDEALSLHEAEYNKLKEATSILELVLWKNKIIDHSKEGTKTRQSKKTKLNNDSSLREQCRVSCGADIVIPCVFPYLLPFIKKL